MDRYQRVEKPRPESAISENEIRITSQGMIRNYISYATSLFQDKHAREIVLKAMGQAINKAVAVVEIMKKRIPGLYQDTSISSSSITDVWEPIEEGLVPLETTRHVSMITITLSTRDLNVNSSGYQVASNVGHPRQQPRHQPRQQQMGQTYHQPRQAQNPYNDDYSYGRGQGRGRGRGRGFGRGGYDGYGGYRNYQDENWNWGQGGGRGRGWNYHGYERGRGVRGYGGRGYGRARGRTGGRGRGYMAE
ncbi:ribonuclease P protein subunit p25 isoform X2 [Dendrobium catenatum]|uniref:ribonuclease P protein subunit p25 isoform X2 n=1 Tax=Dendrobium catenatum TaxID=906689 RepID=UPI0009F24C04|nr:ribonuclease P protein subunit p25 isoform X2 [Dendrobium catenatum]